MARGVELKEPDTNTRVVVIKGVPQILGLCFGGLHVDRIGSIKVGKTIVHPNEAGTALSYTIAVINDSAADLHKTNNQKVIEKEGKRLLLSPAHLRSRKKLFEGIVSDIRNNPDIKISNR